MICWCLVAVHYDQYNSKCNDYSAVVVKLNQLESQLAEQKLALPAPTVAESESDSSAAQSQTLQPPISAATASAVTSHRGQVSRLPADYLSLLQQFEKTIRQVDSQLQRIASGSDHELLAQLQQRRSSTLGELEKWKSEVIALNAHLQRYGQFPDLLHPAKPLILHGIAASCFCIVQT